MTAVERYNALDGQTVSREELQEIKVLAIKQGQPFIAQKIAAVLTAHEDPEFRINISATAIDQVPVDCLPGLECREPGEEFTGLEKAVSPDEIYQYITDLMLNTIKEVGHLPWQKEWKESSLASGSEALNWKTKKKYRGINYFLLNFKEAVVDGKIVMVPRKFRNPYFLTFNQIKESGGTLKEGSKGVRIVYFTRLFKYEQAEPELSFGTYSFPKMVSWLKKNRSKISLMNSFAPESIAAQNAIPILKYYNVFSAEDVEGVEWEIQEPVKRTEAEKIESAEAVVVSFPKAPKISHGGGRAYYMPAADYIQMPVKEDFNKVQSYYATLFHEMVHSTGHHKRLDRDMKGGKGTKSYAFEELIAEMGAVYLCAESGILFETRDNSAKYLKGWNSRLVKNMEEDNRFFFRAASQAQAASDFILDRNKEGVPAYQNSLKSESKTEGSKKDQKKEPKKRNPAAFKKGDKAFYTNKKQNITIRKVSIPKKGSSLEHENRVYDITYSNGRKAMAIPESKLEKPRKEDPKPVKKKTATQKDTNQLLEEQKKAKLQAKTKAEFEKGLKKLGFEVVSYTGEQHSPQEWKRNYKLNFKDTAGITLEMELEKRKNRIGETEFGGTSKIEGMGIDRDDYIYYEKPGEFYKEILNYLKDLFDMSLAEADTLKKEYGNTLFRGRQPKAQLGLFGAYPDKPTLKDTMIFAEKHLIGKSFPVDVLGEEVHFTKPKLKKAMSHPRASKENLALVYKLPNMLKKAVLFSEQTDKKKRREIKKVFKLVLVEKLFDQIYRVLITVRKQDKNYYYDHAVIAKIEPEKQDGSVNQVNPIPLDVASPVRYKDSEKSGNQKKGLKSPIEAGPTAPQPQPAEPSPAPEPEPQPVHGNPNSLAARMQRNRNRKIEYYRVDDPEIAKFLGNVEIKERESVGISITAPQGAGKTRFAFQLMNAFAKNYRVGHASMEEHPESGLYESKALEYIDPQNFSKIDAPEINNMADIQKLIEDNDVIVIDSFEKLREIDKNVQVDQDFRKKYDGKLFIFIFQLTSDGKMRGGSKSQFDVDIVLFTEKFDNYKENYIYPDKNRYNDIPPSELKFSIYNRALIRGENSEPEPDREITESRDPISKPAGRLIATPVV